MNKDLEEFWEHEKFYAEKCIDKDKEIEDLKKQIELLVKDDESSQQTIINQRQEIERLDNIINELEEEYINYMDKQDFAKKCKISRPYLDKLLKAMNRKEIYEFCKQRNKIKELKGNDKE